MVLNIPVRRQTKGSGDRRRRVEPWKTATAEDAISYRGRAEMASPFPHPPSSHQCLALSNPTAGAGGAACRDRHAGHGTQRGKNKEGMEENRFTMCYGVLWVERAL